ncbi:MAG: response regulator transcription factor [Actinomycetota bacterium]|nr:response regulator transcription factor [Actinomycetota bacterium]
MESSPAPIRVLIADDTPDVRMLVRLRLELDGRFEVVAEVPDGAAAVAAAESHRPDAVVLDLAMPVMDGMTAIAEIRRASPHTKIVVFSGAESEATSSEAIVRGADVYLDKELSVDEVARVVAAVTSTGPVAISPERSESPPERGGLVVPLKLIQGFVSTLREAVDRLDRDTALAVAAAIERQARDLRISLSGPGQPGAAADGES